MATLQTYNGLTHEQREFYEMTLLETAKPNLCHVLLGQKGRNITLPENKGTVVQFRKFGALSAATTALTEGVTPPGSDISVTEVTAEVKEYGDFVRYSKFAERTTIDPIVVEISEILGDQAGLTMDVLTRDVLAAGGTVQYAGDATTRNTVESTDIASAREIMEAIATLRTNNARPFPDGKFKAIVHPKTVFDLTQDSTFMNAFLEATGPGKDNPLYTGWWGTFLGIDFYMTSNAKVFSAAGSGGINVYGTLILGRNAYGVGGLGSDSIGDVGASQNEPGTGKKIAPFQLKTVVPTPVQGDELGQRGSVGWITTYVAKVLDDNFMVRLEHACSLG